MTCTIHDRERCSHCAVLARCAALFPKEPPETDGARRRKWRQDAARWVQGKYRRPWHHTKRPPGSHTALLAGQIASRIVAWIRWPGTCHTHGGEMSALVAGIHVGCRCPATSGRHPLDPLGLTWEQRVEMSKETSHGGINWDFVSIIADQLDRDKPVGWHELHAWREPSPWDGMNWGVDRRPEMLERMRFTLSALRDE